LKSYKGIKTTDCRVFNKKRQFTQSRLRRKSAAITGFVGLLFAGTLNSHFTVIGVSKY
jgi:hypothetical protein